jgi:hypothetical protein
MAQFLFFPFILFSVWIQVFYQNSIPSITILRDRIRLTAYLITTLIYVNSWKMLSGSVENLGLLKEFMWGLVVHGRQKFPNTILTWQETNSNLDEIVELAKQLQVSVTLNRQNSAVRQCFALPCLLNFLLHLTTFRGRPISSHCGELHSSSCIHVTCMELLLGYYLGF